MYFITGFPRTWRKHDSIVVPVYKLKNETHFIPVKSMHKTDDIANIFMKDIFKLHGLPKEIVSDMDAKFTSNFWKGLFADWVQSSISAMLTTLRIMVRKKG